MSYRLTDGIEFMKSLPDNSVDGIVTDPPWGRENIPIEGQEQWLNLIVQVANESLRVLRPGARVLFYLGLKMTFDVIRAIDSLELRWFVLVHYFPPRFYRCFRRDDVILYFALPNDRWPNKQSISGWYEAVGIGEKDTDHPCARNYKVVKRILSDWFSEGEYVIDPFAGSDTTGVACRELNLKYDSCEIDPKMYETGLHRHKQGNLWEIEP